MSYNLHCAALHNAIALQLLFSLKVHQWNSSVLFIVYVCVHIEIDFLDCC